MSESESEEFTNISITIPKGLLVLIDKLVQDTKLNRSQIFRRGLGLYIQSILKDAEPKQAQLPVAGLFVDSATGEIVCSGLLMDGDKPKVLSGAWKCVRVF
jgi:metal-responsive CopG/Arc/MetJ family transcriptional regulator